MAGIFTSIKNALFFALFSIPGIFIFQLLQDYSTRVYEFYIDQGETVEKVLTRVFYIKLASFVLLFFLCGIPLFKFLSDTVEDGVVEF